MISTEFKARKNEIWQLEPLTVMPNLRELRSALDRIDAGTFGLCLDCEEEISRNRLAAAPWAPYCIGCQEMADNLIMARVA